MTAPAAAGPGKSSLALAVVEHFRLRGRFAALVADDGVWLSVAAGRLVAEAPQAIAGLVEIRGLLDQQGDAMTCTPKEFARCAHPDMLGELAGEILTLSHLSGDDRKN